MNAPAVPDKIRRRPLSIRTLVRSSRAEQSAGRALALCDALLSEQGELSGRRLAAYALSAYQSLDEAGRDIFFDRLVADFGPNPAEVDRAAARYRADASSANLVRLQAAVEPPRQELFRRANMAPGGTAVLLEMRREMLKTLGTHPERVGIDADLIHLFRSWFNRGFLILQRIDWHTPAVILERLIQYEAVHQIQGWRDLRRRLEGDRRCYAFFHPALNDEPLIFVEVAFTGAIPNAIGPILEKGGNAIAPERATTAVFYSISNCQRGLTGVSFGSFLIKQVVEEVSREFARLSTFVTLSPVPGFASWLARERRSETPLLTAEDLGALAELDQPGWWQDGAAERLEEPLMRAAATYFISAKGRGGQPLDPVARFHLGNGARLEQMNFLADLSEKGLAQSHGLMVNYQYDLDDIEENHEAFAENRTVVAASAIRKLARMPRELVKA